jgi:hypothetical protein
MASIFDQFSDRSASMEFKDRDGNKTSFPIDTTESISTGLAAEVTSFPVEGRGNITDHIQPAPLTLNLQCVISESPSSQILALAGAATSAALSELSTGKITNQFAQAAGAAAVAGFASTLGKKQQDYQGKDAYNKVNFGPLLANRKTVDPNFPKRAMVGLIKMFQYGAIFNFHTFFTKDIYTDMVMTSLSFTQTPKEGDSLHFTMSCKQIAVTKAFTEKLEGKAANPAGGSLSVKSLKGKVSPVEVPAVVAEPPTGLFKGLWNDFTGG